MEQLISGEIHDPHAILGAHPKGKHTVIRTLRHSASEVAVIVGDERHTLTRVPPGPYVLASRPAEGGWMTCPVLIR